MGSIGIEIFDVKVLYSIYLMIYCIYQRNTVLFSEFKTELKYFRQFSNDSLLKKLKEEKMYFFSRKMVETGQSLEIHFWVNVSSSEILLKIYFGTFFKLRFTCEKYFAYAIYPKTVESLYLGLNQEFKNKFRI